MRKRCSVSVTKQGCPSPADHDCLRDSYENYLSSKQAVSGKLLMLHIQMKLNIENDIVVFFASLSYCQAFESMRLTYWKWHLVLNATYFRMFLLYPINICCSGCPVSSWSSLKFHCLSSHLTFPWNFAFCCGICTFIKISSIGRRLLNFSVDFFI